MRLVQFRRHLDGYSVRVSDLKDIRALRGAEGFKELMTIRERVKGPKAAYTMLSTEFYCKPHKVSNIDEWKRHIWKLLRYRKRPQKP